MSTATASKCNLIPVEDKIIVQKSDSDDKTPGGILLPESAKEKPQIADVIAVGPGKKDDKGNQIPVEGIQVGDKIVFPKYSGTEIKIDGQEYLILKAGDVLAKISS